MAADIITWADKTTGDTFSAVEATEVKDVVNSHAGLIDDNETAISDHEALTNNPHSVTKSQVGLGSVDNTSDSSKPVSTAQATAISAAEDNAFLYSLIF